MSDKCFFFGKILPPSQDGEPALNHFEQKHIEKMNLDGMPLCRMHKDNHVIGKIMTSVYCNDGSRYVIGYIDKDSNLGKITKFELEMGQLPDLSLKHRFRCTPDKHKKEINILMLPYEVSIVDEGQRAGCKIIGFLENKMQNNQPAVETQQNPVVNAPSDTSMEGEMLKGIDIKVLEKEDPAKLSQIVLKMAQQIDELDKNHKESLQKLKTSEAQVESLKQIQIDQDKRVRENFEGYKQGVLELIGNNDPIASKTIGEEWDKIYKDKDFKELENTGRIFSGVIANAKSWKEQLVKSTEELSRFV